MKQNNLLRVLANSSKYQTLLSARREICSVNIFRNVTDFSKIQMSFIEWLQFYKFLHQEVSCGEVSKIVFDDEIYADAYYLWRSSDKYKEWLENKYKNNQESSPHALKITHSRKHK